MKITPLCVSCTFLRRSLEIESVMSKEDLATQLSVTRELLEAISLYIGPDIEAAELATVSFRRLASLVPKVKEFYEAIVESNIRMSLDRMVSFEKNLEDKNLEEVAEFLLLTAAAATGYKPLAEQWRLLEEPPDQLVVINMKKGIVETDKFMDIVNKAVESASPIYYLFAAAHELPYDRLLIEKLIDKGIKVVGVARRERFEDYATSSDLDKAGLTEFLEDVVEIEGGAAPAPEEDKHIIARMNAAPFVVVKGGLQSLYFHNNPLKSATVFIFAANCPILVRAFDVPPRSLNAVIRP